MGQIIVVCVSGEWELFLSIGGGGEFVVVVGDNFGEDA